MVYDHAGLKVTTISQEASDALEETVLSYLRFGRDVGQKLKLVYSIDSNMFMAHVLRGYFMLMMGSRRLLAKAMDSLALAEKLEPNISQREVFHLNALRAWCGLDLKKTTMHWQQLVDIYPQDALALKMLHYTYFYLGDASNLRKSVENSWHFWEANKKSKYYGYLLSLKAFGLEETGEFKVSERLARQAVELNKLDAWGVHCVAHTFEMMDNGKNGIGWLNENDQSDNWSNFRYHLKWHKALFLIEECRYDEVLSLYDEEINQDTSDEYLDLTNSISLLMRMELNGQKVGDRWQLIKGKIDDRLDDHLLSFVDTHFMFALSSVDSAVAGEFLTSISQYIKSHNDTYADVSKKVGYGLCQAILFYKTNQFEFALEKLSAIAPDINLIGGSNAQRDIFELVMIDSCVKLNKKSEVEALINSRLFLRPNNKVSQRILTTL